MPIEVIVASLPRTGTTSIKAALELLGYNETMCMLSCRQNPKLRQAWKEIYANHLEQTWTDEYWRYLFDQRFPEYVAGTDSPFSDFAVEIARAYPNAKVVLTYRDPDAWLDSFQHLSNIFSYWDYFCLLLVPGFYSQMRFLKVFRNWWRDVYNYPDVGKGVMQIYTDKIKAAIEPERLLLYRVQDGWAPLCKFLNKEIPQEKFPYLNQAAEINEKQQILKRKGLSIWLKWIKRTSIVIFTLVAIGLAYKKSDYFHLN